MSEKVRGKRPAVDEPAQKRIKTASSHAHKPGGISLGEDRAVRPPRTAVLEWSDDDEDQSAPPPNTTEAPADSVAPKHRAGESHGLATADASVLQSTEAPEQRTEGGATEHQEERQPAAEAQESSHKVDQAAAPGGQAGTADSRKSIGRPNREYICLGVIILFFDFTLLLKSQYDVVRRQGP